MIHVGRHPGTVQLKAALNQHFEINGTVEPPLAEAMTTSKSEWGRGFDGPTESWSTGKALKKRSRGFIPVIFGRY
jgi:hypothetical protein